MTQTPYMLSSSGYGFMDNLLPESERSCLFNASYYKTGCGFPYERNEHWLNFFGLIADEIIRSLRPNTVLDVGCALGFLVEALWDRGVEAYGIDISAFAISQVRRDMQRYCRQRSILETVEGRYDLVTCIEVLEHLAPHEAETAIINLAQITDTVLFSSTPSDLTEPTHFNVQPTIRWLNQFATVGFSPNCTYDASFVAPHAILLQRQQPTSENILRLFSDKLRIKCALVEREQRIGALNNNISQLVASNDRGQTELHASRAESDRLNTQLDHSRTEIASLNNDLQASRAESDRLNTQLDRSRTEIASLNNDLQASRAKSDRLNTQLDRSRTEIASLHSDLQASRAQTDRLNELEALKTPAVQESDPSTTEIQRRLANSEAEAIRLRQELLAVYTSPGWQLIIRYRVWLNRQRQTSRWIRFYENTTDWFLRRRIGTQKALLAPPDQASQPPTPSSSGPANQSLEPYEFWIARTEPGPERLKLQHSLSRQLRLQPLFSLIVPVYKVPLPVLQALLESVQAQTYEKWELCLVHAYAADQAGRDYLSSTAAQDARIKVQFLEENSGISGNSNAALQLATGEFLGLLDHDDTLAPFALFEMANAINEQPDAGFFYSDKDCIDENGRRLRPLFKPSWSPDLMLAANYLTHFCVIRTGHLREIGGWRSETDGAQDWDIFLRAIDCTSRVVFVPGILYHWRIIATSVASGGLEVKPYAAKAQMRAVSDHLARRGLQATAELDQSGNLKVAWNPGDFLVSIILLSQSDDASTIQDRASSLDKATQWGNLEIIVPGAQRAEGRVRSVTLDRTALLAARLNAAVQESRGECLVFLDDGVEIRQGDWLHEMVGPFEQPEVGIVGVKLLNTVGATLRHAGLVFNRDGTLDYIFSREPEHIYEQFGGALWYRNWSAVSGACFAVRRGDWVRAGGFQEHPAYPRHDVDLCLRIVGLGQRIFYTPHVGGYQSRMASLEMWLSPDGPQLGAAYIRQSFPLGDPFFHSQLESREGKVIFAPPRKSIAKLDYAEESRILVTCFDAAPATIQTSKRRLARRSAQSVSSINWVVPDFSHAFYGGIHTILRFADYFRRAHNVQSEIVELGNVPEPIMRSRIARAFPDLAAAVQITCLKQPHDWSNVGTSDATISTLWTTAYAALHCRKTQGKFYFIQDYEPLFYPAGSTAALVEATYRFGYYGICNTPPLAQIYQDLGGEAAFFTPSVDSQYFFDTTEKRNNHRPYTVFCYARPGHPRNCFELLGVAMRSLKERMGGDIRIISAGAEWNPSDYDLYGIIENLGLLGYSATGALYRACHAGVVMMMTRHPSYLPLELMACGALVVTNHNPYTTWLLKDEQNCLLTEPSATAIAETIERGLRDENLRQRIAANAADIVRTQYCDWDAQAEKVYQYILSKC